MNAKYTKFGEGLLNGQFALLTDDIRALLVDSVLYSVDLANDEFLADIPGGAIIATSQSLSGKDTTDGILSASDTTFVGAAGLTAELLILYKHTGSSATSRLMVVFDTATGLALTPNGSDVDVRWPVNGIFEI